MIFPQGEVRTVEPGIYVNESNGAGFDFVGASCRRCCGLSRAGPAIHRSARRNIDFFYIERAAAVAVDSMAGTAMGWQSIRPRMNFFIFIPPGNYNSG